MQDVKLQRKLYSHPITTTSSFGPSSSCGNGSRFAQRSGCFRSRYHADAYQFLLDASLIFFR
jgi:hypothetical protein